MSGELEELNGFGSDSISLLMRFDASNILAPDKILIADNGYIDGQNYMFLNWVSTTGDLLEQISFESPYLSEDPSAFDTMFPWDVTINQDGEIYTVSAIESGQANGFDTYLIKHSSSGNILWDVVLEAPFGTNSGSINVTEDGVLVCYGEVNFENEELIDKSFVLFDESGAQTWINYQTGLIVDHAEESVFSNGLVTVATGFFYEATPSQLPVIYQVDLQGDLQWITQLDVTPVPNVEQHYTNIVQSSDGGFVVSGVVYELLPQNPEQNGDFNWDGILAKYSSVGELLWKRNYNFVSSTEDEHIIIDHIQTSDDGFLFCGYANDWANEEPEFEAYQQGWLVKTNEYGCLVPGCHVSIDEFEKQNGFLKINPNPAEDFINVFIGQTEVSGTLEVVDGLGRVIDQSSVSHGNTTFLFDCTQYQSGQYMVRFVGQDRGILEVEKVLVR